MNASILYEDYLVAARRFLWSGKRNLYRPRADQPNRWKVRASAPDRKAHGDALRNALLRFAQAAPGGKQSLDIEDRHRAERVAKARLEHGDLCHAMCQCGAPECDRLLPGVEIQTARRRVLR